MSRAASGRACSAAIICSNAEIHVRASCRASQGTPAARLGTTAGPGAGAGHSRINSPGPAATVRRGHSAAQRRSPHWSPASASSPRAAGKRAVAAAGQQARVRAAEQNAGVAFPVTAERAAVPLKLHVSHLTVSHCEDGGRPGPPPGHLRHPRRCGTGGGGHAAVTTETLRPLPHQVTPPTATAA